jgi:hypothetical protein
MESNEARLARIEEKLDFLLARQQKSDNDVLRMAERLLETERAVYAQLRDIERNMSLLKGGLALVAFVVPLLMRFIQ